MVAVSCYRSSMDRLALVQLIRRTFARSPIFREPVISDPLPCSNGQVTVKVSFDQGPPVFRVVAPSEDEVYTILYELASAMVEIDPNGTPFAESLRMNRIKARGC
jgi:hypothetical protein